MKNDAEHAWHMAIMAYLLREYANERVNIERVMIMCLIHDIVEIDAGDTYAYDARRTQNTESPGGSRKERIFSLLPDDQKKSFPHCLMNLRQMKRRNQDLHIRWTICNL